MTRFFEHVLSAHQLEILSDLAPAVGAAGFYLAGGTAMALHLGHRRSDDFAWFAERFPCPPIDVASSIRSAVAGFAVDEIEEGAETDPMPDMLTKVTWDTVRNRLEHEVERLA